LLNVTLCYPDNNRQPFFDMLSGKLTRIVVHVDLQPIADELHGDYINDKSFKRHFQQWLNSLWQEKDRLLTSLMGNDSNLLIVFYVQIMPDDFVMQLHRF
nr:hypothetical protein [Escherichia coli]